MNWLNKNITSPFFVSLCIVILLVTVLLESILFMTKYKITDIDSSESPNGKYKVIFQEVGESDWPFGHSHARLLLLEQDRILIEEKFDVAADGCTLSAGNWNVSWNDNCVQIIISGKEQPDELYVLYFDGSSSSERIDTLVSFQEKTEIETAIEIIENQNGEWVFSISQTEFEQRFNALFQRNEGRFFFSARAEWQTIHYESGIHSSYETDCHTFTEDPNIHVLPTISVYTPSNDNRLLEVTVNFDWHSYTEGLYANYEQMCFYTLKVFFPDLEDEQINSICKELNTLANQNMYSSDQWYGHNAVPCALYYRDQIGVYSYLAVGDWMYLCIIPLSEKQLDDFQQKGVQIHEIE